MAPVTNQPTHTPSSAASFPPEKTFDTRPPQTVGRSDTTVPSPAPAPGPNQPWWMQRFSPAQWQQMERDDYVMAASIFGILTAIFFIGLLLTTLAVVFS